MGDSDDEYDRKRRDKFRGERAEASYRGPERVARPRDDWAERDSWSRPRPREYRPRDRGYSPSMEPQQKRMRHDFYGDNYGYNHYTPYQPPHRGLFYREPLGGLPGGPAASVDGQQPPMMSFKAFLATQDDNISDSEAIEKYNDYKLEFQRQQLNEFFVAHKDEEWFRLKYHPEDSVKRKEEQAAALKKRVEVFIDLLNSGKLGATTVDCARTNDLLKLMDTVVIKLEGGTEEDLALLEQEYLEMEQKYREQKEKETLAEKAREARQLEVASKKEEGELDSAEPSKNKNEEEETVKTTNGDTEDQSKKEEDGEIETEQAKSPEKKEEVEEEETKKDDDETMELVDEAKKEEIEETEEKPQETPETESKPEKSPVPVKQEKKSPDKKRKRSRSYSGSSSNSSSSNSSSSDSENDDEEEENDKKKPSEEKEDEENAKKNDKEAENVEKGDGKDKEKDGKEKESEVIIETIIDDGKPEKPKALHKTTSIFLRNLAPTITKQEVEAMCSRYDGFLRVALADPQPERRWLRRGWVTFKREANIKEICWNLNNIRLRECELGAIVNRDLSRRIRPVNGITAHKQVVRSDIRIAAKVTLHLDSKTSLWPDDDETKKDRPQQTFGLVSNNPVLHNITDYLIEEASAEEEELLGLEPTSENQESASTVDRDESLISVLDKIILYLRIVHSVDYYNHCEYPQEDEMPNRCGILHARGPPPTTKTDMTQFLGATVEAKMANFLPEKPKDDKDKNESKLIGLSLKDVDTEIDKFVQANTRELAKDKWLCPLSGKKFKGPDFVRKHIFNKHAEKIEEVKKEVEFFNNYLRDPKRPMLAEAPQPKREDAPPTFGGHPGYGGGGGAGGGYGGGYGRPHNFFNQGFAPRARGFPPRAARGGGDFRPVIHYRDLDAPREPEEFI